MKKLIQLIMSMSIVFSGFVVIRAEEEPGAEDSGSETMIVEEPSSEETDNTSVPESEDVIIPEEENMEEESSEAETEEPMNMVRTLNVTVSDQASASVNPLIRVTLNPVGEWKKTNKGWWFRFVNGSYPKNEWIRVNDRFYRFDGNGYMQTGWIKDQNLWFYCDASGAMVRDAWQGDYYLGTDGTMMINAWIGSYYVGSDGRWIPGWGIGKWKKNSRGWWYDDGYGGYPADTLYEIGSDTYYFNKAGYMQTGWQKIDGDWYYFNAGGTMKKSAWQGVYYLLADGRMAVNADVDNGRYHVGADGRWISDWGIGKWIRETAGWRYNNGYDYFPANEIFEISGSYYLFDAKGYMLTGWQTFEKETYYLLASGVMKIAAWEGRYYLKDDGRMAHDEMLAVGTDTYLFNSSGITLKGWQEYEGKQYYFSASGIMRHDIWQDNVYLKADGSRAENEQVDIKGEIYWFGDDGAIVTGWQKADGNWYFMEDSGRMKRSEWEGEYYLLEDGKMAVNTWVDKDTAYVGEDGKVIPLYGVPHWVENQTGWWYSDGYGNYPASAFMDIDGSTYYFNERGYMVTGWQEIDSGWYYFQSSGRMARSTWMNMYYLKEDGTRAQGETLTLNGTAYVFDAEGRWTDAVNAAKWIRDERGWWYSSGDGTCPINEWALIGDKNYHFDSDGYMQTGWLKDNGCWYYLTDSGAMMQAGWLKIQNDWYFFHEDGTMAAEEAINGFYVGSDGKWINGAEGSLTIADGVGFDHIKMQGIDISEHNGDIDLSRYKDQFVIIRIGYWTTPDKRAVRNMDLCEKYNIPYGVYLYDYTTDPEDAVKEAEFTLKMIKGRNIQCGVWFDMEDADGWKHRNGLDPSDPRITQICQKYCDTIKNAGYHVGIYASYSWFGTYIKGYEKYDVWVAHWGANDGKMNINLSNIASLHQYTSIPLDKNVMYVDLEHLK